MIFCSCFSYVYRYPLISLFRDRRWCHNRGVEGVGVGAVVATGGVAGAGDGATTEAGTLSCVWDCFGASTLTGLVAGTALLEQPLMASNSARDIPATFIFHEDFKNSLLFFDFPNKIQYCKGSFLHSTILMVL